MYLMAGLVSLVAVGYFVYQGYLETRVNTPLDYPKVVRQSGLDVPDRFWGSYRPGVYFGMKTRSAKDIVTGLMWFLPRHVTQGSLGLRHWCEQGDNLKQFGWNKHDGRNFGIQNILDRGVRVETSFVKVAGGNNGGDWTNRISFNGVDGTDVSMLYYVAVEEGSDAVIEAQYDDSGQMSSINGKSSTLSTWKLWWETSHSTSVHEKYHISTVSPGLHAITDTVMRSFRLFNARSIGLESSLEKKGKKPNLIVLQLTGTVPFTIDIAFESDSFVDREDSLVGEKYTQTLAEKEDNFDLKFEQLFQLSNKGYNDSAIHFAQSAMSNMIGGIGYFYGSSIVKSKYNSMPVPYWEAPLYTAVPSRSFFPRGFLWDEGFHNLLISKWDPEISADIVAHWLDLMNSEGWIPREQILGSEARAKVPIEFVVQSNKNANHPTLLLTLHSMVKDISKKTWSGPRVEEWFEVALVHMWPRLVAWYSWFDTTQAGEAPGTFRWRGRDPTAVRELNPKTLTSGLDDYPRASHPTEDERHVDLRCWMGLASKLMADIAAIIGRPEEAEKYNNTANFLHDNWLLDDTHWSEEHHSYLDYGLHTDSVVLAKPQFDPNNPHQSREKVRKVLKEPRKQFVNQVGYISLFPLLLGILDVNSPKLGLILDALEDPEKMYTPYGLRSLSKRASMYNKYNTEHDAPYWRGPIWLNINFLAVRALHRVRTSSELTDEKVRTRADRIYRTLRTNLINNVMGEYRRTGYIWEQYDDKTGKGKGCKPFTGWSALVVLLMSENY